MELKEKFKEELINHIFGYEYVTGDRDGTITMWKEKPSYSKGGDYWVGGGESMEIHDEFQFSEFKGVDWTERFISLNSNNDEINELNFSNDELNFNLLEIKRKIDSVNMISGDVDLTDYLKKLRKDESDIEKLIDENSERIKELKPHENNISKF